MRQIKIFTYQSRTSSFKKGAVIDNAYTVCQLKSRQTTNRKNRFNLSQKKINLTANGDLKTNCVINMNSQTCR